MKHFEKSLLPLILSKYKLMITQSNLIALSFFLIFLIILKNQIFQIKIEAIKNVFEKINGISVKINSQPLSKNLNTEKAD